MLYGVAKIGGLEEKNTLSMVMKDEQEIYVLWTNREEEKLTYGLQACKIG